MTRCWGASGVGPLGLLAALLVTQACANAHGRGRARDDLGVDARRDNRPRPWPDLGPARDGGSVDDGLDGGPRDVAPDDGPRDDGVVPVPLVVDVRIYTTDTPPLEGAWVRVDGQDGFLVEGRTDAHGRASLLVDPRAAPYDLTIADTGRGAVSILGLEGSPAGRMFLPTTEAERLPSGEAVLVTGSIDGYLPFEDGELFLAGESLYQRHRVWSGHDASFHLRPGADPAELLVLRLDRATGAFVGVQRWSLEPRGAAELRDVAIPLPPVDPTRGDTLQLTLDALFGDETRGTVHVDGTLEFLSARELPVLGGWFFRRDLEGDEVDVTFSLPDGDAPLDVVSAFITARTPDGDVVGQAAVRERFDRLANGVIEVPAGPSTLVSEGRVLGDDPSRVTIVADDHEFLGMNGFTIEADWYVYSAGPTRWQDRAWPRLPTGINRDEAGFSHFGGSPWAFATTELTAAGPWEWDRLIRRRCTIRHEQTFGADR